jgi:membrane associated rhomboid family serine protease
MSNPVQNISDKLKAGNKLYLLIGINVIVFLVTLVFGIVDGYLRLPAYLPALAAHFWTPLTYQFVSDGLLACLFNMLWLYWMGRIFEDFLGTKRILGLYLLGGLVGAALFILCSNFIPPFAHTLLLNTIGGSTVGVLTIMVATATLLPNNEVMLFIWPVKLKWIVGIYILFDLININSIGFTAIIAHAGGALFGVLYIKQLQKGHDMIGGIANLFKARPNLKVAAKNPAKKASYRPRQEEVDRILDKISKTGYDNLNKEEKEILFRASKNES